MISAQPKVCSWSQAANTSTNHSSLAFKLPVSCPSREKCKITTWEQEFKGLQLGGKKP